MSAAQEMKLSNKQDSELRKYLEAAKPDQISGDNWSVSWGFCHGETRSTSTITFHLGTKRDSSGERLYHTAIVVEKQEGSTVCPVMSHNGESTHKKYAEKPDLKQVMLDLKKVFPMHTRGTATSSSQAQGGNGDQGGGDGGNGNGNPPKPFEKEIKKNVFDEYYFIDEQGENIICDEHGNPIVQHDAKTNKYFYMDSNHARHTCTVKEYSKGSSKTIVMKTVKGAHHKCKLRSGAREKCPAGIQMNSAQGVKKPQTKPAPGTQLMINGEKHVVLRDGSTAPVASY